jgi:thioredoxin 1
MKLLKLEQPNCRNCGNVAAFLEDNGVKFTTVDVSKNPDVAAKYDIMTTPVTILLDDNGNEVQRSAGFDRAELETLISQL